MEHGTDDKLESVPQQTRQISVTGPRSLFDSPYAAVYHHFQAAANTDCFTCHAENLYLFLFISFAPPFLSPISILMRFPMPTRLISKKQAFLCASAIFRDRDKREIMFQPRQLPHCGQPQQSTSPPFDTSRTSPTSPTSPSQISLHPSIILRGGAIKKPLHR